MTMPLALDFSVMAVALAGAGAALRKRLALLDGEGVVGLSVFAPGPDAELAALCGDRLVPRLPHEDEIAALRVLFVAGLNGEGSADLAATARRHRVLVNVEDVLPLCDFHVPAIVRRGALAISISTGGASPTLSRRLRRAVEELLPLEWADRVDHVARLRAEMRAAGATPGEVMAASEALIDREGWLPPISG